jgi:hypothetical protein
VVERLDLDSQVRKIFKWIHPPDPSTNFENAKHKRYKGTGSWFLESKSFREWKSGIRRYLWLHGIPGCGKTVLCSTIIDHLCQRDDSSDIVLAFFFDFRDIDKQSLQNLIRSLIAQLYGKSKNSRKELDQLFTSCDEGVRVRPPNTKELSTTFQHMMSHVEKIQIIIDALDECRTRGELLRWLEELTISGRRNLYLITTSRKEEELESGFKRWLHKENIILIQQDPVDSDIREYIRGTLRADNEFQKRWRLKPYVLEEIESELMKKAGGM